MRRPNRVVYTAQRKKTAEDNVGAEPLRSALTDYVLVTAHEQGTSALSWNKITEHNVRPNYLQSNISYGDALRSGS